jgi:peptidoglycan hydrolase-like protein with peptidoglycan-binding domain
MMKKWTSVMALALAGVLTAAMAFAQGSDAGGNTAPTKSTSQTTKSTTETTKSTDMKSSDVKNGDAKKSGAPRSGTMAKGGHRENVRAAQQALRDQGMDPGSVDGVMGPKTQAALRDYQKKEGLKETGRLDAETMSKLGVSSKTSAGDSSSPAASPSTSTTPDAVTAPADASKDAAKDPAAKTDAPKK